jgi:AcrR family transcriptional regulator
MAGPAQKRRRMTRADRERQIVAVAEKIFAERGYATASMDEIAEAVGVSKPMLYEYFGSKDGLLLACITRARSELLEATQAAIATAATPEETMWRALLTFFTHIEEHVQAWCVLRNEGVMLAGPAADEIDAIRRQQTDLIAALLATYAPSAPELELIAHAEIIVGAGERLAVWREHRPEVTAEQAARYLMDVAWSGFSGLIARYEP